MKRIFALFIALATAAFILSACTEAPPEVEGEETSFSTIQAKGEIVIGLDDTFAPMGFRDTAGKLIGFDIDFAEAVAKELDVTAKFVPIDWSTKEMQLDTGKIDLIWNGLSITPERQELMLLTEPYLNNRLSIMVKNESNIDTLTDLIGKKVGIQAASSALEVVQKNDLYEELKENLVEYPEYDSAVMDMEIGRVEAVIIDEVAGRYKNINKGEIFKFATEDFGPDEYGVGMKLGADSLYTALSEAMNKVKASGQASEISEKWLGEDLILK